MEAMKEAEVENLKLFLLRFEGWKWREIFAKLKPLLNMYESHKVQDYLDEVGKLSKPKVGRAESPPGLIPAPKGALSSDSE